MLRCKNDVTIKWVSRVKVTMGSVKPLPNGMIGSIPMAPTNGDKQGQGLSVKQGL